MTFDEWYDKQYAQFPNYQSPLMKEHARVAWNFAISFAAQRVREDGRVITAMSVEKLSSNQEKKEV